MASDIPAWWRMEAVPSSVAFEAAIDDDTGHTQGTAHHE
jgi:hypothetical protein